MNKFRAKPTVCAHGHKHASVKEAKRCDELHLLEKVGKITLLKVEPQYYFVIGGKQVKFPNGRRAGFKPDFSYCEVPKLNDVAEDCKGGKATKTEAYALRATLFRHLFPEIDFREV